MIGWPAGSIDSVLHTVLRVRRLCHLPSVVFLRLNTVLESRPPGDGERRRLKPHGGANNSHRSGRW
jgi:hypothetical protein